MHTRTDKAILLDCTVLNYPEACTLLSICSPSAPFTTALVRID